MKKIIYLLFLLMFASCSDKEEEAEVDPEVDIEDDFLLDGTFFSSYYVQSYMIPTSLKFSSFRLIPDGDYEAYIYPEDWKEYNGFFIEGALIGSEYDIDDFEYYAIKYGDTSYNREMVPFSNRAFAEPLDYINVTTRNDYDAEHTAGSLINDVAMVRFWHYYDYVSSGYEGSGATQIIDYLENVNGVGYCMVATDIGHVFALTLQPMPTESGSYIFDVEVKIGDAVLSGELTMEL